MVGHGKILAIKKQRVTVVDTIILILSYKSSVLSNQPDGLIVRHLGLLLYKRNVKNKIRKSTGISLSGVNGLVL
jgi:hypothetical protein